MAALASAQPPRLLSPFVLAELDDLIGTRAGHAAQMALLDEVVRGAYRLEPFSADDVERATRIMERYKSLSVGLTDASVVVLAHRHATLDLLCTDQRHSGHCRGRGRDRSGCCHSTREIVTAAVMAMSHRAWPLPPASSRRVPEWQGRLASDAHLTKTA